MNQDTTDLQNLARRLMVRKAGDGAEPAAVADAAEAAYLKLHHELGLVIGPAGVAAMEKRAAGNCAGQFPDFGDLLVPASGGVDVRALRQKVEERSGAEAVEVLAALFGSVIEIMVEFLGANICLEFLKLIWPVADLDDAPAVLDRAERRRRPPKPRPPGSRFPGGRGFSGDDQNAKLYLCAA